MRSMLWRYGRNLLGVFIVIVGYFLYSCCQEAQETMLSRRFYCEVGSHLSQTETYAAAVRGFCRELAFDLNASVYQGLVRASELSKVPPSVPIYELIIDRTGTSSFTVRFSSGFSADWLSGKETRMPELTHSILDADLTLTRLRPLSVLIQRWIGKL